MKNVILDTDFLIHSLKFRISIKEELSRVCDFPFVAGVLDKTLEELQGKPLEKLAKAYIEKELTIFKTSCDKPADDLLLFQTGAVIATDDKELKERLKKANFPIISIRQKKYYHLENVLSN